jgi:phage baseplate assembly protein W
MNKKPTIYKDLDIRFIPHPVSGDLVTKTNQESIKQSIRNLIQTQFYDHPFEPNVGCQARGILFMPVSDMSIQAIKTVIIDTLSNYEPRVIVLNIAVSLHGDDANQYKVDVLYTNNNSNEPEKVVTYLKRIR